jgi:pentatricopeptide repeat domain-containing protein 1
VVEQKKKKKSKSKSAKEPAAPLVEEVEHVDLGGLSATEHSELISDIKSCGNRRGGWKLALQMLEDVKVNGGHRTAGLVHATMVACTNQRHMAQAVALLEDMRTSGNPAPDKFCYDAGIHAYRLLRDREKALELLAEMPSKGLEPTSYTYSEAIRSCRNTRDGVKVAEDLMRDYIAARGAAPRSRAAKTDLSMLHGHHHHDHHDEELPVVPRKLFVCYSYLWVLAAAKEWRKATVFLQAMAATEETPDRVCYNAAIKACSKAGMWREATRLLDQQRYDTSRGKKVQKVRLKSCWSDQPGPGIGALAPSAPGTSV